MCMHNPVAFEIHLRLSEGMYEIYCKPLLAAQNQQTGRVQVPFYVVSSTKRRSEMTLVLGGRNVLTTKRI